MSATGSSLVDKRGSLMRQNLKEVSIPKWDKYYIDGGLKINLKFWIELQLMNHAGMICKAVMYEINWLLFLYISPFLLKTKMAAESPAWVHAMLHGKRSSLTWVNCRNHLAIDSYDFLWSHKQCTNVIHMWIQDMKGLQYWPRCLSYSDITNNTILLCLATLFIMTLELTSNVTISPSCTGLRGSPSDTLK